MNWVGECLLHLTAEVSLGQPRAVVWRVILHPLPPRVVSAPLPPYHPVPTFGDSQLGCRGTLLSSLFWSVAAILFLVFHRKQLNHSEYPT